MIEPDELELTDHPPALRGALWTALAVFVCTALLAVGLAANIEPVLLRFLAAILFAGGFTALAVALTRTSVSALFGSRPRPVSILLALLVGAAVWLPVSWAIIVTDGALGLALGTLSPPSALGSGISPAALVIQFGIVVPACLGLLFFAYVQRAADGIGRVRGAWLAAALFALHYALVASEFGASALLAYLALGLAAAFCGHFSGSAWNAIAALIGFHLVRALFENTQAQADLFVGLGVESAADLVGLRWLLAVAVALFVAFAAIQTLRALAPPRAELSRPGPCAGPVVAGPAGADRGRRGAGGGHRAWRAGRKPRCGTPQPGFDLAAQRAGRADADDRQVKQPPRPEGQGQRAAQR